MLRKIKEYIYLFLKFGFKECTHCDLFEIYCDLREKDMTKDRNKTRVTLEDDDGGYWEDGFLFKKKRKIKIDICDECLKLLKSKAK